MKNFKNFKVGVVGVIALIVIVGGITINTIQMKNLYKKTISDNSNLEAQTLQQILDNTNEIELEKKIFSLKKHYYIKVDDIVVGEVIGKFMPIFGDELTMIDSEGQLVKKEYQIKRLGPTHKKGFNVSIDRLAELTDAQGNTTGYIGEEKIKDWWKLTRRQYFYDNNYKKIASAKQNNIFFCKNFTVYDNDENIIYSIDGNLFSLRNKTTIEKKDNTVIDEEDVIFYTIIENSIIDSQSSSSSSSSSSSKK